MMKVDKELKDVVDETISLENIFFPEDKSKCYHVALSGFLLKKKNYCIMQCANCKKYLKFSCSFKGKRKGYEQCAIGEVFENKETGELLTVLPCDGIELRQSGEWK